MIGKRLGNFEIEEKIGAGGMGEVYRARDTRLDRIVAIKILPPGVATDPRRRERFQREAQALSRLNHPHVCTLYDVGKEGDVDFLVMEHLEGTPLSDRLAAGALPPDEALAVSAQIADGLDAAHRAGVVHRDLKPANVMLTRSGAKILDFGLAKEGPGDAPAGSAILTATVDTPGSSLTEEGTILGTLQYMSPEQLHGEPADARSDLFSFGAMLYEMVAGDAPFAGKSQASVIASILEREPTSLITTRPDLPPALDRLIQRCLRKNPEERLQNARDAMLELRWIAAGGDESATPGTPAADRRGLSPVLALAAAALALAAGLLIGPRLFGGGEPSPTDPVPMVRARIPLPEGHRLATWGSPTVTISDDGGMIAFVTQSDSLPHKSIWLRHLDENRSIPVPGSESGEGPAFSPDGKWLLFAVAVSGGGISVPPSLRKYSLESGLTQTVCEVRDFFGADWLPDGTIVWAGQLPGGLWRIPETGGTPENFLPRFVLGNGDTSSIPLGWPSAGPDGGSLFVSRIEGNAFSGGSVIDVATGRLYPLEVEAALLRSLPGNRVAYVDLDGTLLAAPYDPATRSLKAAGIAVDRGISIGGASHPIFDVSGNGTAIFARGPVVGTGYSPERVIRIAPDGTRTVLPVPEGIFAGFAVSPDGRRIVISEEGILRLHDSRTGRRTDMKLGDNLIEAWRIVFSPDGRRIAMSGPSAAASISVFEMPLDGSTPPRMVYRADSESAPHCYEPDGNALLVFDFALTGDQRTRMVRVPLDGGDPEVLPIAGIRGRARLSPQGDYLVYRQSVGDEVGIFLQTYPDLGPRISVAQGGYREVLWSPDGSRLYAFDEKGLMVFPVRRSPFEVGTGERRSWDVSGLSTVFPDPEVEGGFYGVEDVPGAGIVTELEIVTGWVQNLP